LKRTKVWRDLIDKDKAFYTTCAKLLKARLPISGDIESEASKLWSSERSRRTGWYCWSIMNSAIRQQHLLSYSVF